MITRFLPRIILSLMAVIGTAPHVAAQVPSDTRTDTLERGFQTPPASAKPRVWWHWMNGNVTKAGITADLEWMRRVGIGGMQMFDIGGMPKVVEHRLVWMTPEWKDALRHAAAEADRLGLEMAMAASGGWSETAGPWVTPDEAMKRVAWSETIIRGGRRFHGLLPRPDRLYRFPNNAGPKPNDSTFFRDVKVLAYHVVDGVARMAEAHPTITSSAGAVSVAPLTDRDSATKVKFVDSTADAWIQVSFPRPYRAYAITVVGIRAGLDGAGLVQASRDSHAWTTLTALGSEHTTAFAPTTARYYRILLHRTGPPEAGPLEVSELDVSPEPRVHVWEDKAQYGRAVPEFSPTPDVGANAAIAPSTVVDLTTKLRADGTLTWDVPPGRWVLLRLGYTLTGQVNHPASPEATGFEVDKLSRTHVERYMQQYIGMVSDAVGAYFGKSFRAFLMDSWEAGTENWTEELIPEFTRRRGYDPTPYLLALTGRVVGSADASDRFLWDFRRTLADLLADNHYAVATRALQAHGVGLYAEAVGIGLPATGDGLLSKGQVSIPMGEFWVRESQLPGSREERGDVREAASAAHIYGKGIAAAESFTGGSGWYQKPSDLKQYGDWAFASGINRLVIHTSVHQPFTDDAHKPGLTLYGFGQHYTRNNSWAEQSVALNTYFARSSYLLQQGLFVGDIAYYYGEGVPIAVPGWKLLNPAVPAGYDYDCVNTDVLLTRMSVQNGRLTLPDGMSYRVLVLPADLTAMTLPVIRKVRDLVAQGATLIAPRPTRSPSLTDAETSDDSVRSIAAEVWGNIDGTLVTSYQYGKGTVFWGLPIGQVLESLNIPPDFTYTRPSLGDTLVWIHRRTSDADIYFVANQRSQPWDVTARFRVHGKDAELWHPDDGTIEPASYTMEQESTTVPFHLDPLGSTFVVFRHATTVKTRELPTWSETQALTVQGPWTVSFPPAWGAPPSVRFDSLQSWSTSTDAGVKYFSGTATYHQHFDAPAVWLSRGNAVLLDLGTVNEVAEVSVNGTPLGILWKPPFRVDITRVLKPGVNQLDVKVTNLWVNRMIGDEQPGMVRKYTFSWLGADKDAPLLVSGLLGPVHVVIRTTKGG